MKSDGTPPDTPPPCDRRSPGGWQGLWSRMTPQERLHGALGYLEDAKGHAGAEGAAVHYIAAGTRTREAAVRRMSLTDRAVRLARMPFHPTPYLHTFAVSLHRRQRSPMLTRFLDVAAIPHTAGHVDVARAGEPAPLERLVAAVATIAAEHPPAEVSLYLDALELEAERPWSRLAEARRLVEEGRGKAPGAQGGAPV
jgi:hypothetical protein